MAPSTLAIDLIMKKKKSTFFAFNPDGTQKWTVTLLNSLENGAQAHVGFSDGTIYVAGKKSPDVISQLWAFDQDGTLKWTSSYFKAANAYGHAAAQGADGSIYGGGQEKSNSLGVPDVANGNWGMHAINRDDGTLKWKFSDASVNSQFVASVSFGSDGTIYAPNRNGYLYALSPDGTLKWSTELQAMVAKPAVSTVDGTIYLGTKDGVMYAIDPLSGGVKWSSTSAPKAEEISVEVLILYKKAE